MAEDINRKSYNFIQHDNITGKVQTKSIEKIKVRDVMTPFPWSLTQEDNIKSAEQIMRFKKVRHIPVIGHEKELEGIVSHKDILNCYLGLYSGTGKVDPFHPDAKLKEIMTTDIHTVSENDEVYKAAELMAKTGVGCLLVVNGSKLSGILTGTDLMHGLHKD